MISSIQFQFFAFFLVQASGPWMSFINIMLSTTCPPFEEKGKISLNLNLHIKKKVNQRFDVSNVILKIIVNFKKMLDTSKSRFALILIFI